MTPMRPAALATALSLALSAGVVPASASARQGFKAERLLVGGTYHIHSVATLCGSSKFGTYHITGTGTIRGKTLLERATVPLLNDGRPHAFHVISIGGTLITSLPPADQALIRNSVRSALNSTTVTVTHVNGNTITTLGHLPGVAPATGHVTVVPTSHC